MFVGLSNPWARQTLVRRGVIGDAIIQAVTPPISFAFATPHLRQVMFTEPSALKNALGVPGNHDLWFRQSGIG